MFPSQLAGAEQTLSLEASGSQDVVEDRHNGRLVDKEDPEMFARAIEWIDREADSNVPREAV